MKQRNTGPRVLWNRLTILITAVMFLLTSASFADTAPVATPSADDMQRDAAIQYAKEILYTHFDVEEERFDTATQETFFGCYDVSIDAPIWVIEITDSISAEIYRIKLYRNGDLISYTAPSSQPYAPGEDELTGAAFTEPGPHDISQEQALEIAKFAIGELGDYQTRMDQLSTEAYFLYSDRFNHGWEPVWLIHFYQEDVLVQKVLLGYDGSFISTASGDKQLQAVSRIKEPYYPFSFTDVPFFEMSLEDRAALSAEWIPYVNKAIETYPYYPVPGDFVYAATRYVYGVPDENNISQDEATETAKRAIIAAGANEDTINTRRIEYRFDITDETNPVWRVIFFSPANPAGDFTRYRVIIDANTADVIETLLVDTDTPIMDYRF